MFRLKKCVLFIAAAFLLFSGCKAAEAKPEDSTREVSSEAQTMGWGFNLRVEEGDLKESGVVYEDAIIEFQDPVVEEMLRNMIGKSEGAVYISELQEIHAIYWHNDVGYWSNLQSPEGYVPRGEDVEGPWEPKQPNSLEDLAYCYNLQSISFGSGVEVPSLKPLRDLPQLETLKFGHASITEEVLAEIGELSKLKNIRFGRMELSSLESLLNLPQLEALDFEGTTVTEEVLEDIGQLPMLKSLKLGVADTEYGTYWGELTDGSFLIPLADQLTALDAAGGIDWNPEVLAQMTNMERLGIDYADDLSFLEQMPELKKLSLYCCCPKDWSPLGSLEKLEHLEITGNMHTIVEVGLEDLRPITNLDYLEVTFTSINKEHSREEIIEALPSLTGLVSMLEW